MRVFKKKVLWRNQSWKNKKRRRRERSGDDRSQPDHIPLDLTLDILSRLPAKSIVRYQCVSKLWSSLITLPIFINTFASRSSSRSPRLLITFTLQKEHFVFSFPQNQNPEGSYSPVYSYHMKDTYYDGNMRAESVQGLILLYGFRIWNPSLRRIFTLPHPEECNLISLSSRRSFLCYDPLEGKHKVLCLYYESNSVEPRILTLGGQETWRIITKGRCPMHSPSEGGYGRCFNGILYYTATVDDDHDIIMSFDVKSEIFSPINYPEGSPFRWSYEMMIPYEGRLALVTNDFPGEYLYILKDADGHKWTRQCLPPVRFKKEWRIYMQFKGVTDAGELIFAPRSFVDSFYILYFDPRRNITREAFFEGFMGDEFRRSDHGVPNDRTDCTGVFVNHMESLVCL